VHREELRDWKPGGTGTVLEGVKSMDDLGEGGSGGEKEGECRNELEFEEKGVRGKRKKHSTA